MTLRFFSVVTALLCSGMIGAQAGDIVARSGDVELPTAEIVALIQSQPPEFQKQILDTPEALNKLIKAEALRRAVLQEALKVGTERQASIALQLSRARDQVIIDHFLQQRGEVPADYPLEKDLEAAYANNKEQFKAPAMIHLAQVLVRGPMEAPKEFRLKQMARAMEAHRRIIKGEDFALIVRDYSEDEEARNRAGDLGWLAEADVFPLIRMEIAKLPVGGVSKPIRTQFGWQIMKVVERRAARIIPFAEARAGLVSSLRKTHKESLQAKYLKAIETLKPYEANAEEVQRLRAKMAQ